MKSRFSPRVAGAPILLSCLLQLGADASVAAAQPSLRPGCFVIVDAKAKATLDNADEVLCVDAAGRAMIRESSLFGEGVRGCNVVTTMPRGDELVVDINYRKCTNSAPSHELTCRADATPGAFACTNTLTSEKADDGQVRLVPLPAGQ